MTSHGEHIRLERGAIVLDRYEVLSTVGSGNFSKVYRVLDRQLPAKEQRRHPLAMKVIKKEYTSDARYERQMLLILEKNDTAHNARVSKMHEYFTWQDCPVLIMPIHGASLRSRRLGINRGVVTREKLLEFAFDILETLAFVHVTCHMVHTDLKPENILLSHWGVPENSIGDAWVVCDFGSASLWRMEKLDSDLISTRPYRAPEVVLGNKWHYAADMWSLGCILYEVAIGHRFFEIRDDLTHLHLMDRRIGRLPEALTRHARHCRRFFNSRGDFLSTPDIIRFSKCRLTPLREMFRDDPAFLRLLEGLFVYNPDERITAADALKLPLFDKVRRTRIEREGRFSEGDAGVTTADSLRSDICGLAAGMDEGNEANPGSSSAADGDVAQGGSSGGKGDSRAVRTFIMAEARRAGRSGDGAALADTPSASWSLSSSPPPSITSATATTSHTHSSHKPDATVQVSSEAQKIMQGKQSDKVGSGIPARRDAAPPPTLSRDTQPLPATTTTKLLRSDAPAAARSRTNFTDRVVASSASPAATPLMKTAAAAAAMPSIENSSPAASPAVSHDSSASTKGTSSGAMNRTDASLRPVEKHLHGSPLLSNGGSGSEAASSRRSLAAEEEALHLSTEAAALAPSTTKRSGHNLPVDSNRYSRTILPERIGSTSATVINGEAGAPQERSTDEASSRSSTLTISSTQVSAPNMRRSPHRSGQESGGAIIAERLVTLPPPPSRVSLLSLSSGSRPAELSNAVASRFSRPTKRRVSLTRHTAELYAPAPMMVGAHAPVLAKRTVARQSDASQSAATQGDAASESAVVSARISTSVPLKLPETHPATTPTIVELSVAPPHRMTPPLNETVDYPPEQEPREMTSKSPDTLSRSQIAPTSLHTLEQATGLRNNARFKTNVVASHEKTVVVATMHAGKSAEENDFNSTISSQSERVFSAALSPLNNTLSFEGSPRAEDYRSPARCRPPVESPFDAGSAVSSPNFRSPRVPLGVGLVGRELPESLTMRQVGAISGVGGDASESPALVKPLSPVHGPTVGSPPHREAAPSPLLRPAEVNHHSGEASPTPRSPSRSTRRRSTTLAPENSGLEALSPGGAATATMASFADDSCSFSSALPMSRLQRSRSGSRVTQQGRTSFKATGSPSSTCLPPYVMAHHSDGRRSSETTEPEASRSSAVVGRSLPNARPFAVVTTSVSELISVPPMGSTEVSGPAAAAAAAPPPSPVVASRRVGPNIDSPQTKPSVEPPKLKKTKKARTVQPAGTASAAPPFDAVSSSTEPAPSPGKEPLRVVVDDGDGLATSTAPPSATCPSPTHPTAYSEAPVARLPRHRAHPSPSANTNPSTQSSDVVSARKSIEKRAGRRSTVSTTSDTPSKHDLVQRASQRGSAAGSVEKTRGSSAGSKTSYLNFELYTCPNGEDGAVGEQSHPSLMRLQGNRRRSFSAAASPKAAGSATSPKTGPRTVSARPGSRASGKGSALGAVKNVEEDSNVSHSSKLHKQSLDSFRNRSRALPLPPPVSATATAPSCSPHRTSGIASGVIPASNSIVLSEANAGTSSPTILFQAGSGGSEPSPKSSTRHLSAASPRWVTAVARADPLPTPSVDAAAATPAVVVKTTQRPHRPPQRETPTTTGAVASSGSKDSPTPAGKEAIGVKSVRPLDTASANPKMGTASMRFPKKPSLSSPLMALTEGQNSSSDPAHTSGAPSASQDGSVPERKYQRHPRTLQRIRVFHSERASQTPTSEVSPQTTKEGGR